MELAKTSSHLLLAATGQKAEYKVAVIGVGFVKRRDGEDANIFFPAEVVQASAGLLENAGCFIDHPQAGPWEPGYPQIKSLCGVFHSSHWDETSQSVTATLRLNSRSDLAWLGELLDEYLSDLQAGEPIPDLGLSASLFLDSAWQGQEEARIRRVTQIKRFESVDIVYSPGLKGKFLERLSASPLWHAGEGLSASPLCEAGEALSPSPLWEAGEDLSASPLWGAGGAAGGALRENRSPLLREDNILLTGGNMEDNQIAPPTPADPLALRLDTLEQQLTTLTGSLTQLSAMVARQEDDNLVRDLGQPPRRPYLHSMLTGLDQFSPVVDWLFGVREAPLPDYEFRRADAIYRALTGDHEFRGVFDPDRVLLASATTTTLSNLAVNAMNKVIVHQFSNLSFWRWYERIVWVAPNDGSLHDMQWITFGGIGNLPTVAEGAAYTELAVDDVKEADPWVTKGGYVGISRKMLKNSEIQRIQAVPVALATACIRTRSAAVSAIFTDNSGVGPTLDQDSTALFHSNHANLGTTAFSQSEWRVVRTAIFKHTDVNSAKRLGYFPKYALVPADLYDSALAVFGYGDGYPTSYTPEAQDRGLGDPRPVPLVVPDWTDTNNWAAMVDPLVFPVIQMSYAQAPGGGVHPPCEVFVASDPNAGLLFSNDTLPIKVRDEFVCGVNGPRGIYKENVA